MARRALLVVAAVLAAGALGERACPEETAAAPLYRLVGKFGPAFVTCPTLSAGLASPADRDDNARESDGQTRS